MREFVLNWYVVLGGLSAAVAGPLRDFGDSVNIPALSALLLGLIGATAPCQLTTNAGALAFVARRAGERRAVTVGALAYVAGKVAVYTVVGTAVIVAGREIVPVEGIVLVRRLLGPLMLAIGLFLLGVLPFRFSLGGALAGRIEERAGSGALGAFFLGTAFSVAFCPTLFLLFFVFTIPLALASPAGVVYPGLFALGTALPLLVLAGALAGGGTVVRRATAGARGLGAWLRPAAAGVLVLAGLHDTVTYWLL